MTAPVYRGVRRQFNNLTLSLRPTLSRSEGTADPGLEARPPRPYQAGAQAHWGNAAPPRQLFHLFHLLRLSNAELVKVRAV